MNKNNTKILSHNPPSLNSIDDLLDNEKISYKKNIIINISRAKSIKVNYLINGCVAVLIVNMPRNHSEWYQDMISDNWLATNGYQVLKYSSRNIEKNPRVVIPDIKQLTGIDKYMDMLNAKNDSLDILV